MSYKMTLRRRLPNGELETATYELKPVGAMKTDSESLLLFDMEIQANGTLGQTPAPRPSIRMWVEEDPD